jgi:glutamyl-tRNA reductase
MEKALKRLGGLSEKELQTIDSLTCAIVNKMLHGPTARLKSASEGADGYTYVETARLLYGLDDGEGKGHGVLRNLLNRKAQELQDKANTSEIGDSIGSC